MAQSDMAVAIVIIPLFAIFLVSMIIRPKWMLNLTRTVYKRVLDIDLDYSQKTENALRVVCIFVLILSSFALYMQFKG